MLIGCRSEVSETIQDERLNTRDGALSYTYEASVESELQMNPDVSHVDSCHVEFENSKNSDLYVGTYVFGGNEYTAGYAKNCDFKEYLEFPDIESAEAETVGGRSYNFAYYKDDVKAGYYYASDYVCVYVYTDEEMTNEEFKEEVGKMDIQIRGVENEF